MNRETRMLLYGIVLIALGVWIIQSNVELSPLWGPIGVLLVLVGLGIGGIGALVPDGE